MRKIKFTLKEKTKANQLYLLVNYAGGDADTEHPEMIYINDIVFDPKVDYSDNVIIKELIKKYKILETVLSDTDIKYNTILKEHGKDIADLYKYAPKDPQCDYQFKCYIEGFELIGYDSKCNEYICNI